MTHGLRRLLWPAVMSVCMIGIMLGLGFWQLTRLTWKQDVLASIERAEAGPAMPLPANPSPFAKIRIQGTLRNAQAAFYGADVQLTPAGPKMGAHLIVPLDRPGAAPVLVDRGWVPLEPLPKLAQPEGQVTIEGFVRPPDHPAWFSPTDNPASRRFYTLDPRAIGAALGIPDVAPFVVVAIGQRPAELFPLPAQRLLRPPNDHLNYAITWFGLAAVLTVIFSLYARKVLRP